MNSAVCTQIVFLGASRLEGADAAVHLCIQTNYGCKQILTAVFKIQIQNESFIRERNLFWSAAWTEYSWRSIWTTNQFYKSPQSTLCYRFIVRSLAISAKLNKTQNSAENLWIDKKYGRRSAAELWCLFYWERSEWNVAEKQRERKKSVRYPCFHEPDPNQTHTDRQTEIDR